MTTVRMLVQLDTDAIQAEKSLKAWTAMLGLGGVNEGTVESGPIAIEPDWEAVYERLACMWIGCQVYQGYSVTAQDDLRMVEQFVLNEGISLVDDKPTAPAKKVTVLPLVPPSTKRNGNGS